MPPTRPSFASLGLAPLILRVVVGGIFLWAGLCKLMGTMQVQGADAAVLANMGALAAPQQVSPAAAPAPSQPLPAPSPTPKNGPPGGTGNGNGGSPGASRPSGSLLILAQAQAPTSTPAPAPVTSGPALATAADFPQPVACRAMWGIALAIHHAAHPAPVVPPAGGPIAASVVPMKLWPAIIGDGLWPKYFAIAVLAAELGGGGLLLIGLFTRVAAFATAGVMLGAIWLTQVGPAIQSGHTLLGFLPAHEVWDPKPWTTLVLQVSLLGSSLAIMCIGCGIGAVDWAIAGGQRESRRAKPAGGTRASA